MMRTAATIIMMVAAYVAVSLMLLKPEAGVTVRKDKAEGAAGSPAISSFNIMVARGKSLPLENWRPAN